jgi:hypothetical protein
MCTVLYCICRQCVAVGGGGVGGAVDHILQEFYTLFLITFRTYKIASPVTTPNKNDQGFVSVKFLRPS